ncbi:enkurin domain-containing protein 1 [Periophthalmus magnuspinnatus]|uniref:enkurin domain-containing protein 1 n=1 Tax=Periophthalmus magnuspinnatus TaxID=409849 RepID=UPI002436E151|nr:enkurin domain-containing protein 1 [Periophthalmus magnuspinnatus]
MCEGPSSISGPIPPDPSLFPELYKRTNSARGRLEGQHDGSLLSGPLAPDPVLYPGFYTARTPAQHPRIGPNAAHILERGKKGVVGELLKLDDAPFIYTPKQKHLVQDFGKENVRRLREIQKRYREQQAEITQSRHAPVKALSSKYLHVPSKVTTQLQIPHSAIKPQCQNFLKAHGASQTSPKVLRRSVSCNFKNDKNPQNQVSNSEQEVNGLASVTKFFWFKGQTVNFIKHNAKAAGKTALRRSQSLSSLKEKPIPSAVKGQVHSVGNLEERKEQWRREEEERRRNAPDPSAPAGHTLMPESERQETLKSLKESHRSLVSELLSLPLKADNLSVQTRKAHLDCRLSELEEAIKIFSRDKVYVKNDF